MQPAVRDTTQENISMNEGVLACRARGIKPVITDVPSIDEMLMATVEGRSLNLLKQAHSFGLRWDKM